MESVKIRPLSLGLVGVGRQMSEVLVPALMASRPWTIRAVCDPDQGQLDAFSHTFATESVYLDLERMLESEQLDALLVAVGHRANFGILSAALNHGISVFVEKTPVLTVEEADQIVELQRRTGRWVMVGFNRRFAEPYRQAKQLVSEPAFGGVLMFQSQFHARRYDVDSFVINHVIHHLDLARFLLGEIDIVDVQRIAPSEGVVGYTISFRVSGGGIGTIQSGSMLDARFPVERLELLGMGGNIVVDNLGRLVHNRAPGTAALVDESGAWNPTAYRAPHRNLVGYESELAHFLENIRAGTKPTPDMADARRTMLLVEQVETLAQL